MKDLLIGAGIGYAAYLIFGKKKETVVQQTTERVASFNSANSGSCRTCQRPDGSYYMSVGGSCKMGDSCVSHNY